MGIGAECQVVDSQKEQREAEREDGGVSSDELDGSIAAIGMEPEFAVRDIDQGGWDTVDGVSQSDEHQRHEGLKGHHGHRRVIAAHPAVGFP